MLKKYVCVIEFIQGGLRTTCVNAEAVSHRVIPFAPGDEPKAAKELGAFCGAAARKACVVVLFPRAACVTGIFRFPSIDPREVRDMATLQFVRSTPHKREDIVVGAKSLKRLSATSSLVAGVMTTKDALKPCLDILEQAALSPDLLTVNTVRLLTLSRAAWGNEVRAEGRVIGAALDGALNWGLIAGGDLVFSREEPDGADMEASFGAFVDHGRKEFPDLSIQEGVLIGDLERAGGSRRMSGVAIEVRDLASLVRTAVERSAFELSPVAYLDLLFARDPGDTACDLSPEYIKVKRQRSKVRSLAVHLAIIAGIFLAGLLLRAGAEWQQRMAVVVALRTAVGNAAVRVKELEDKARKTAAFEKQVSERVLVSEVLQRLSKSIPLGVRLNEADIKEGSLNIQGEAAGLEEAQAFLKALASAEGFRDVRLESIDKRPTEAAEVVSFRMKMKVQR